MSSIGVRIALSNCARLVVYSLNEYKLTSGQPSASFVIPSDLLTTILISGDDANDFEFEKLTTFVVPISVNMKRPIKIMHREWNI